MRRRGGGTLLLAPQAGRSMVCARPPTCRMAVMMVPLPLIWGTSIEPRNLEGEGSGGGEEEKVEKGKNACKERSGAERRGEHGSAKNLHGLRITSTHLS